jgi:excisionase family DNA binding protein
MMTQLLDVKEVARLLGIGRTKLNAEFKSGKLGSVTIGRRRLVLKTELERYIADLPTQFGRTPGNGGPSDDANSGKGA